MELKIILGEYYQVEYFMIEIKALDDFDKNTTLHNAGIKDKSELNAIIKRILKCQCSKCQT